jgi:hypothetical protein
MKNLVRISIYFLCAIGALSAGNFQSQVVQAGSTLTINVRNDGFLVIRNFTQEEDSGVTARGFISVTDSTGLTATVLTATIVDPTNTVPFEPVNDIVIAGPSTVTVTGGNTNCFITYRKAAD